MQQLAQSQSFGNIELICQNRGSTIGMMGANPSSTEPDIASRVRTALRVRRARSKYFSEDLFADPAWDILLELYLSSLTHRKMSVSDVCIGAAVPSTTALRWVRALEARGLLQRSSDPLDGRRFFVSLSAYAESTMERYFLNTPSS